MREGNDHGAVSSKPPGTLIVRFKLNANSFATKPCAINASPNASPEPFSLA
jgi:hypothetical protein